MVGDFMIDKKLKDSAKFLDKVIELSPKELKFNKSVKKRKTLNFVYNYRWTYILSAFSLLIVLGLFITKPYTTDFIRNDTIDNNTINFYTSSEQQKYYFKYEPLLQDNKQLVGIFYKDEAGQKQVMYTELFENVKRVNDIDQLIYDDYQYLILRGTDQENIPFFTLFYFNKDNVYPIYRKTLGEVLIEKKYLRVLHNDSSESTIIPIDIRANDIMLPDDPVIIGNNHQISILSNVYLENNSFDSNLNNYIIRNVSELNQYLNYTYELDDLELTNMDNFQLNVNYEDRKGHIFFKVK
jgi:hypothetical protein